MLYDVSVCVDNLARDWFGIEQVSRSRGMFAVSYDRSKASPPSLSSYCHPLPISAVAVSARNYAEVGLALSHVGL